MSGSESAPAGWYSDPQNPGQQRYWDGSAWTEATQPAPFTAPPPPPAGPYAPPLGYGAPGAPMGYGYPPSGQAPNNYMAFAILSTLLCCLPAGIVSIVKASQVNSKWMAGDTLGAEDASRQAKQWAIIAAVAGVLVFVIYAIIIAASGDANDF